MKRAIGTIVIMFVGVGLLGAAGARLGNDVADAMRPAPARTTPAAQQPWIGLPECEMEDSPGPCWWNARTRGNHLGKPFWVDEKQVIHYIETD